MSGPIWGRLPAVALCVSILATGCQRPQRHRKVMTRPKPAGRTTGAFDLLKGRLPDNVSITVDGHEEDAWQHAAAMPCEEWGRALFAWDNQMLFGYVTCGGRLRSLEEQLCIRITATGTSTKSARLCFGKDFRSGRVVLRQVLLDSYVDYSIETTALPLDSVLVHGALRSTCVGSYWKLEFSLPWRILGLASPEGNHIYVRIYRLVPTDSPSWLRMDLRKHPSDQPPSDG